MVLVFSGFVHSPASHLPLIFSGALGLVLVYPHRSLGSLFLVAPLPCSLGPLLVSLHFLLSILQEGKQFAQVCIFTLHGSVPGKGKTKQTPKILY